jgi:hypothetical protein
VNGQKRRSYLINLAAMPLNRQDMTSLKKLTQLTRRRYRKQHNKAEKETLRINLNQLKQPEKPDPTLTKMTA